MTMTTDMTPANSFDLQSIETMMQEFAWLTISHPKTGEPTPMRVKLANPDSEAYKAVDRRVSNKRLNAIRKAKNGLTVEALNAFDLDLIIGVTLGWENVAINNETLDCNAENARMLYTKFPFIREQVQEFTLDRANFFSN